MSLITVALADGGNNLPNIDVYLLFMTFASLAGLDVNIPTSPYNFGTELSV